MLVWLGDGNQAREGPVRYGLEVGFLVIWYGRADYPRFTLWPGLAPAIVGQPRHVLLYLG
jgi:hypothetical protein